MESDIVNVAAMVGDHASLHPGALIADQFRLRCQIGEGGVGSVWEADHLRLGGMVAIKFLSAELLDNPDAKLRFVQEARSGSKIRSPHVVQVLDHGTTEAGIPYLVMERLEGRDLAAHLDQVGRCGLIETALILDQIGRALTKAHGLGLVHRDIKPHNIFLTPEGDNAPFVKLLDFGIAKDVSLGHDLGTLAGAVMGSVHYVSPEQIQDAHAVGPTADIWALGVVVYEMLTGQVPFDGETWSDVLAKVEAGGYRPACELRPTLPGVVDLWLHRAIHPDPSRRFPSVEVMTREFAQIAQEHASQVDEKPNRESLEAVSRAADVGRTRSGVEDIVALRPRPRPVAIAVGICLALGLVLLMRLVLSDVSAREAAQAMPLPSSPPAAALQTEASAATEPPINPVAVNSVPTPPPPPAAAPDASPPAALSSAGAPAPAPKPPSARRTRAAKPKPVVSEEEATPERPKAAPREPEPEPTNASSYRGF
ncbi:MAG: serine/threonine-protein kinase [Polyangiales bacterium]